MRKLFNNIDSTRTRFCLYFRALILLLFIILFVALLPSNVQSIITLSTHKSFVGQQINIFIDTSTISPKEYYLLLESETTKYLLPIRDKLITFIPPAPGKYTLYLIKYGTSQIIEQDSFEVIENQRYNTTQYIRNLTAQKTLLTTNKLTYRKGEKVIIKTTLPREEWNRMKISCQDGDLTQDYIYEGESQIVFFVPQLSGNCTIFLLDPSGHTLALSSFTIAPNQSKDTSYNPPKNSTTLKFVLNPQIVEGTTNRSKTDSFHYSMPSTTKKLLSSLLTSILTSNITLNTSSGIIKLKSRDKFLVGQLYIFDKNNIRPKHFTYNSLIVPYGTDTIRGILLNLTNISNNTLSLNYTLPVYIEELYGLGQKAFVIDTNISMKLLIIAEGRELWKCAVFDSKQKLCKGKWQKIMNLTPGREYTLDISPGDPLFVERGLSTINSERSHYLVGDTATIFIVVLDKYGYKTDANISGYILTPSKRKLYFTQNNLSREEKGVYNYSFILPEPGEYSIYLNATGQNVNTSIYGKVLAVFAYPFDIMRSKVLYIDPWREALSMNITIIPRINITNRYTFIETIPKYANITNISFGGYIIDSDNSSYYKVVWENLSGISTISYAIDPPKKTPSVLPLGPSTILYNSSSSYQVFNESRVWVVAIDPSSSTSLPIAGSFTGTYSDSGGSYTNTYADDTSYWYFGSNNNLYDTTAWAVLTYDISSLGVPPSNIINLTFKLVYCHDGSGGGVAACDGDAAEGTPQGTQLVQAYDYSSGTWVTIGSLRTDDSGFEVTGEWSITSNIQNFISSTNRIRIRYEMDYYNFFFQDSWLVLDYAPLIVTYKIPPSYTNWGIRNGTTDIANGDILTRRDAPIAHAKWNPIPNQAFIEHNGSGNFLNYTISPPYLQGWTNYTLQLSNPNEFSLGKVSVSMWAQSDGLWNYTNPIYFYLWSYATLDSLILDPNRIYIGNKTVIKCRAIDEYSSPTAPLQSYNVEFYINSSLLGTNLTDNNGWAYYSYAPTQTGTYNISCKISQDPGRYLYLGTTPTLSAILEVVNIGEDVDPPLLENLTESKDPIERGGIINISVDAYDPSNISNVWIDINGQLYNLTKTLSNRWYVLYDTSSTPLGSILYTIYANDTLNNIATLVSNFTVIAPSQINVNVTTDKQTYYVGENVTITTKTTLGGAPTISNITSDIIKGNTTYTWWNISWRRRKPIYLTNPQSFDRTNEIVLVNISGFNGTITNCYQIRIVSITGKEVPFTVVSGDNTNWCQIKFLANISASATNQLLYFVYYDNPTSPLASYSVSFIKQVFFDDFETSNFASNWQQDSQADWFRSTQRSYSYGSYSAEVDGFAYNAYIQLNNPIDLRGAKNVTLSFAWFIETNWDAGEYICLDIFDGAWHTDVDCIRGNVQEGYWVYKSFDIGSYNMVSNFNIRFRAMVSSSAEDGNIDLVNITIHYSDVSASLGGEEKFISRNFGTTNLLGELRWIWDSTSYEEGYYSVVSYATKSGGYTPQKNSTRFRLLSTKPIIWWINASPLYQKSNKIVNLTANITSITPIDNVEVFISTPSSINLSYNMISGTNNIYYYVFTNTTKRGTYSFYVIANDTAGRKTISNLDYFYIVGDRGIASIKTQQDAYQANMNVLLQPYIKWSSGDKESGVVSFKQESSVIFQDGFENGLSNWVINNDTVGTVTNDISNIDSDSLPHSGSKALYMFSDSADGANEQMTATLSLNLTGRKNVILSYYWAQEDLEADDGGFLDIFDGTWHTGVRSINGDNNIHSTSPQDYKYVSINLSALYNLINNFQIRFRGVMEGTYNIDLFLVDDILITADPLPEENSTKKYYSFGGVEYNNVNDIKIVVGIDYYSKNGSLSIGNKEPDLRIGIFNGSSYLNYTCKLYNVTTFPYNCTLIIRDKDKNGITDSWRLPSNRKIFVQGINLDGSDVINYSYVEAEVNTPSRLENYGPTTLNGTLIMQVLTNNSGSFQVIATLYNNTISLSPYETIDLSNLWPGWNTDSYPTGYYMAYVALLNSSHDVIIDEFGYPINDSYIFQITTAPLVKLVSPPDNSWTNSSFQILYFNVSAINSLSNCSLYINNNLNQTKTGSQLINPGTNNFTVTFNDGTYNWSVTCWDNSSQIGNSEIWIINIDTQSPIIIPISPTNNSLWNISSLVTFTYNVTDANEITSCSLIINGSTVLTDTTINKSQQEFNYNLENGFYEWWITCKDIANNTGNSFHYFLQVNYTPRVWKKRWYETFAGGNAYSSLQTINLLNYPDAPDGNEDYVQMTVPANLVRTFIVGYSPYLGGNGIFIPAKENVTFVGVFEGSTNVGYITWKLYKNNDLGDELICMSGDDYTGGTRITPANTKAQFSNKCNIGSSSIRLGPNDRLKLIVNIASQNQAGTYIHYWDAPVLNSYFEFTDMYTLSFIKVNLTQPNTTTYLNVSDLLNVTCTYECSPGTCLNVEVFIQYNSSTSDWKNISYSGEISLKQGANPSNVGNISNSTGQVNYSLSLNQPGTYNIRCYAKATYSSDYSDSQTIIVTSYEAPNITLVSPPNNSWHNTNTLTLTYLPQSSGGISNCTLILDGNINQTDTTINNNAENSFTVTGLSEGKHNWSINCTTTSGVSGSSDTWYFWVDLTPPTVTLNKPLNNSVINKNRVTFNFTYIDVLSPNATCRLYLDGNQNVTNIIAYNNTETSVNVSGLSIGLHNWSVACEDLATNTGTSETWVFNITDTPPQVTLISPLNNTWHNDALQVLYFNVTENNNIINCSLYINNNLNQTKTGSQLINPGTNNFTVTFNDGTYNWSVTCIDDSSLSGTSETWIINIDTHIPIINLIAPVNNTQFTISTIDISFNATDNLAQYLNCTLYLNNVSSKNITAQNSSTTTTTLYNLSDGPYYWNVTCKDLANNTGTSETRVFNISEPPTVTLINPPANAWVQLPVNFTYLPTDNSNIIENCTLIIDGSPNVTNTVIQEGQVNNFTIYSLSEGTHTWTVNCTDPLGLTAQPSPRFVFVDVTAPNITLISPPSGSTLNSTTVMFNFTATDNLDSQLECNLTVDFSVMQSGILVNSGSYKNITLTLEDGYHEWSVTCWDNANNINTSDTWNFTIKTPPTINVLAPNNNTWTNNLTVTFRYIPSHSVGISSCELIFNGVVNQTDTSVSNGVENNFTIANIAEGYYEWWINCTSTSNVEAESEHRILYVDRSPPNITVYHPLNNTIVNNNIVVFNFTATDNLDSLILCNFTFLDAVDRANINVSNGTIVNFTNTLHDGNYNYSYTCWDNASNIASTGTIYFTVEAPPEVTLISPENGLYTQNTTLNFEYRPYDPFSILYCELYLDNIFKQNDTIIENNQINIFTLTNISEGKHNWSVKCIDADNNAYMPTPWNFTIDLTAPTINLLYPSNGATIVTKELNLSFSVIDSLSNNMTCNLTLDNSVIYSGTVNNNTIINVSTGPLQEAIHYWNVTCKDLANNTAISPTWNFSTIAPPNVTLVAPPNNTWVNASSQTLYFNVSDNTGLSNCSLYINNNLNQTKTGSQLINPGTNNFTVTFNDGTYNWSVTCTDNSTAHATGYSDTWLLNVDTHAPNATIETQNNTWFNTFTPTIWFKLVDNMAEFINYTIYVDNNQNKQGQAANNTSTSTALNPLPEGQHDVFIRAIDYAANKGDSNHITIFIDKTKPTITLISPGNNSTLYTTNVTFTYSVLDNLSPNSTCTLYLDGTNIDTSIVNNNTQVNVSYISTYGQHTWNVTCRDLANNTAVSETWVFTIVMPDLIITTSDISFNDTNITEGENITISAIIRNIGDNNATSFTVEIRKNNLTGQLIYSTTIPSLNIGENYTINTSVIAELGINNFFVLVDTPLATNGTIQEKNESNNYANNSFIVESWHYIYGNATAALYMYDAAHNYSFSWNLSTPTGTRIYVVDSDSNIDWSSLWALGKTTTNATAYEDFSELDQALGSTYYPDNITVTFTNNGIPKETKTLTIFGKTIYDIPFTNSTNNSNFKTGILWDTSDGGTTYNGSQDVVFITLVNHSLPGKYGIYDFEIRVPAKLRNYVGATDRVDIYTEIR